MRAPYQADESLGFVEAMEELQYVASALSSCQPVIRGHDDEYRCSFCYQKHTGDITIPLAHRDTCEWYRAMALFNRMGLTYKKVQKMDKENGHDNESNSD